jgi:hypothetical protein
VRRTRRRCMRSLLLCVVDEKHRAYAAPVTLPHRPTHQPCQARGRSARVSARWCDQQRLVWEAAGSLGIDRPDLVKLFAMPAGLQVSWTARALPCSGKMASAANSGFVFERVEQAPATTRVLGRAVRSSASADDAWLGVAQTPSMIRRSRSAPSPSAASAAW